MHLRVARPCTGFVVFPRAEIEPEDGRKSTIAKALLDKSVCQVFALTHVGQCKQLARCRVPRRNGQRGVEHTTGSLTNKLASTLPGRALPHRLNAADGVGVWPVSQLGTLTSHSKSSLRVKPERLDCSVLMPCELMLAGSLTSCWLLNAMGSDFEAALRPQGLLPSLRGGPPKKGPRWSTRAKPYGAKSTPRYERDVY